MFEMSNDYSHLHKYNTFRDIGFEYDTIGKICFQSKDTKVIYEIKEWLEDNFIMYQYKKDNGVKFGEEELFYWSNGTDNYFTVDINEHKAPPVEAKDMILEYISTNYPESPGYIRIQYATKINWKLVDVFIKAYDIRFIAEGSYKYFAWIKSQADYCGCTLSIQASERLLEIEKKLLDKFVDKTTIFSVRDKKYKGALRQLDGGNYAFFKNRATKTYYPITLSNIENLKLT